MNDMRTHLRRIINTRLAVATMATFCGLGAAAQLNVAQQVDLQALANSLEGQGVRIENATVQCHTEGYGTFTNAGNMLGATEGVLLTTGTISNALGPNNVENRSFAQNTPGDPLLNIATGRTTYDACRLEFDLIPSGDSISFDFVFASEEYNEWVGSQFNDVFGFFISGPGIIGDPGMGGEKNIALVPATSQAVSINNVNNGSNSQYFHDNTGGSQIQYDGFTKNLKARSPVTPCQTYRMKIVVADASDRLFDSGLFIQKIKSNNITMQAFTNGIAGLVEGCNAGHVRFSRPQAEAVPHVITYFIQGTATNGVDYAPIGDTDPNIPRQVIIPAGATHVDVALDPIDDGITEGTEYIRFILGNPACPLSIGDTLDVQLHDMLPVSVSPAAPVICAGGSVQLTAAGGATYAWSPSTGLSSASIANPVASPAATTTYTVTITNGTCVNTVQRTVTVVNMALSAITTRPLCQGGTNGAINLTVSNGTPPYTFNWTGPNGFTAQTEDLVNIGSGTYTVTVTDANGCPRVQSFNVGVPALLEISTTTPVLTFGQNIACFGTNTGSITLAINGGAAPYSISWNGPGGYSSTTQNISDLGAGTYNVTVTDLNGCEATSSRTLFQTPPLEAVMENVTHVACHGGSTGSATVAVSGGMPPYSYSWNTTPAQTTATATGLAAGSRTVTMTDGYGCTTTANVVITQPAPLAVSFPQVSHVVQCQGQGNPHGSATAVPSGGTPPYSYHWNTIPVQTTATASFSTGGTWTVTITDANECTVSSSVTVTQPGTSAIQIDQWTNVTCHGVNNGSAMVTITGGSNVQSIVWNTVPPQYGLTLVNVPPGTYNAIAQHANGCQSTATVTIDAVGDPLGIPEIGGSGSVTCYGDGNGSIELTAQGGTAPYTYSYNGTTLAGSTLTGLAAGGHLITVTDANGCSSQGTVNVDGPTSPLAANITSFTNVLCTGAGQGTAAAAASGGTAPYTYEWNSTPVQTGPDATDLEPATYTVTVTDGNGCTAMTSVTINGPDETLDGTIESFGHVSCFGANDGWATVTAWGGSNSFTFTWNTEPPIDGPTATGLSPGMYLVEISDNNGCDASKFVPININGPAAPLVHSFQLSNYNNWNTSCNGSTDGWIDLTITGGNAPYYLIWSDAFGNSTGIEDPSGLDAADYFLQITDAYGCVIRDTVTITAPQAMELEILLSYFSDTTNVSCSGAEDGSADLTITGGTGPYDIVWSNNQGFHATTEDLSGIAAGIYDLEVIDANGCSASTSITLASPAPLFLYASIPTKEKGEVSCHGGSDGSIDLYVEGGTAPYTYQWSNGAVIEDLMYIPAGEYEVLVTDAYGCTATATYELNSPPALELHLEPMTSFNGYGTSCPQAADGSIMVAIEGGVSPYEFSWSGPDGFTSTDLNIHDLVAGSYTLVVTDDYECVSSATAVVTTPAPLQISISSATYNGGHHIACAGVSSGSISMSVAGGVPSYAVVWTGPDGFHATTNDLTALAAGTYDVVVTDANGCIANGSITLTAPGPLVVDLSISDAGFGYQLGCSGNDGSIALQVHGGTPQYEYSWNGPAGSGSTAQDVSALVPGTYTIIVMDANGCKAGHQITMEAPPAITAAFTTDANVCEGGADAAITTTVEGGAGTLTFEWAGPSGFNSTEQDISGLEAGAYTLAVTDEMGCTGTFHANVNDPGTINSGAYVSFYGVHNLQCPGDSSGVIELYPTGGTGTYEISVVGPDGLTSVEAVMPHLTAGIYEITITDGNGCSMDTTITLTEPVSEIVASLEVSGYPSGTNVSCHGGSDGWIEATVTGGSGPYEIFWRGPDSLVWNMADIYDLPAGNYSYELVVIDANQCTFSTEVTLTQPDQPITATTILSQYSDYNVSCHGSNDGSIDLTVSGGNGGFTYAWLGTGGPMGSDEDLNDIGAGAYLVTITDINGCVLEHNVVLQTAEPLYIDLTGMITACAGSEDGTLDAFMDGGAGILAHTWNGAGLAPDAPLQVTGLPAGTYCISVVDMNGCEAQECITISTPAPLAATFTTNIADCGAATGTIDLEVSGGTSPHAFAWSTGSSTEDLSGLASGTYDVVITDASGCKLGASATIDGAPAVKTNALITDLTCHGAGNGAIDLTIIGGTAPFQISWSNGMDTEDLADMDAGEYGVLITDAAGCTTNDIYSIMQGSGIQLQAVTPVHFHGHHIGRHGGNDGSINILVEGGVAPYQFEWSTGAGTNGLQGLAAGSYMVEVSDGLDCKALLTVTLTEPSDLEMPTGYSPNGDGANDVFIIRGLEAYPGNQLTVFNRWGNVVFDRLNYRNDWGGENSNGDELPSGTYFVILTVNNGARTLQGYVDMRR